MMLERCHGLEERLGELEAGDGLLLSSADMAEGDDGRTGAARKWKPRGVGQWRQPLRDLDVRGPTVPPLGGQVLRRHILVLLLHYGIKLAALPPGLRRRGLAICRRGEYVGSHLRQSFGRAK